MGKKIYWSPFRYRVFCVSESVSQHIQSQFWDFIKIPSCFHYQTEVVTRVHHASLVIQSGQCKQTYVFAGFLWWRII